MKKKQVKKKVINEIFENSIIDNSKDDPFISDKISKNNELKNFAENLENLVDTEKNGLIISIYADWGLGKSTFIDMWGQRLIHKDITALKFNAFKCDHSNEPILPFMTEIKRQLNLYQSVSEKESFFTTIKNTTTNILASTSINFGVMGFDFGNFFDCFEQKKDSIERFRKELAELVEKLPRKKLYLFIDELDRCNPIFAIKLLEIAKHLFDVKGICFILAINHSSLKKVITKIYGLEDNTSGEYLERFFDFQFRLPEPDRAKYAEAKLGDVIDKLITSKNSDSKTINENLEIQSLKLAKDIFICCSNKEPFVFSLRDIEKQAHEIKVFLNMYAKKLDPVAFTPVVVYLLCLRRKNSDNYKEICDTRKNRDTNSPQLESKDAKLFGLLLDIFLAMKKIESLSSVASYLNNEALTTYSQAQAFGISKTGPENLQKKIYDYFFLRSTGKFPSGVIHLNGEKKYNFDDSIRPTKTFNNFFNMLDFIHKIEVESGNI